MLFFLICEVIRWRGTRGGNHGKKGGWRCMGGRKRGGAQAGFPRWWEVGEIGKN